MKPVVVGKVAMDKKTATWKRARPVKKKEKESKKGEDIGNSKIPEVVVSEAMEEKLARGGSLDRRKGSAVNKVRGIPSQESTVSREGNVPSRDGNVCSTSEESLATLCSMIPAGELADLLDTDDLLFCGESEGLREESRNRRSRECERRSIRRSARLQHIPLVTGSVFTEEEIATDEMTGVANRLDREEEKRVNRGNPETGTIENINDANSSAVKTRKPLGTESPIIEVDRRECNMDEMLANNVIEESTESTISSQSSRQPQCLTNLLISQTSTAAMTPPPLSNVSKENFFSNNFGRIKMTKKAKIKRRVPDRGPVSVSPASVLKDLSNLSLKAQARASKAKVDNMATTSRVKTNKATKTSMTNRRKKTKVTSPDTLGIGKEEGRRRESLLLPTGGRGEMNYFEESERSGAVSRRSGEGSRSSLLTDISMPEAVRRSFTGEFVNRRSMTIVLLAVAEDVKPVLSVGDAFWSDSEEEEIISGIFGKKTLGPRAQKQKIKIDRGFLE
eukprot:GFUD01041753.1.p1 GENE.GFUD01041753.1~~GFUD01041753.1.p1  ORF type:complete len:505 (+),score=143.47 GFUD01041753.1:243-1757(+)